MTAVRLARAALTASALVAALLTPVQAQQPQQAQPADEVGEVLRIMGRVSYRQRIALPPEAMLSLRIEQAPGAGAPSKVLAETHEALGARQVPIAYSMTVPRALIDPGATYTLRASISVAGELRLTSARPAAVLTQGAPGKVDLLLVPASPQVGFALPASFAGVLPCADCTGIAHALTLRADGLYHLRRSYLGKPGDPLAEFGRWSSEAGGQQIVLGQAGVALRFAVLDEQTLRPLDRRGQPIASDAPLALRRTAQVDALTAPMRWRGEFRYIADAATFTECASGYRWPVATAGDYLAAERGASLAPGKPGAPRIVHFDGRLEVRDAMEGGPREQVVIERFGAVEPEASCRATPVPQRSVVPRRAASQGAGG